jgi:hypothetical protein
MSEIGDIRSALETRLAAVSGIRVSDELPGALDVTGNATGAVVSYAGTTYNDSYSGTALRRFTVTLLVGRAPDRKAVDKVNGFCERTGATSVPDAIEGAIANVASDVRVVSDSGMTGISVPTGDGAAEYAGVEFEVEVMVP